MQTITRVGWALALLLLSSCRSQQVAFSFRPEPTATSAVVPEPATPPHPASVTAPSTFSRSASAPPKTKSEAPAIIAKPAEKSLLATGRRLLSATPRRPQEATALVRPQAPSRHDTLHIILGALLVVGGVVAGLALGGWLGLGVGAVVVLLGYYFVVLGIGGKHAWLEIFQEFFNM
ncbi:hypothetical protein [Hymenobacter rigui]|uniref:Uncharacterized protein n=1 Tax=Hymenobacter rigui TaxID=334424 RepID=A0A428KVY6_9BACT|nr:hypothetical protein [Hymenobacter rigui]RSK50842.1 hypothetical protein EI291_00540 [Hymenobacter rigui]